MQKIRIKKAPNKGDQRDYSLYDRTSLNPGAPDNTERIGNTMGPVDREDANVEVEKGEVVIGDTNQDGFLELFTFTGKPHSKGGTPVNIPPGSFIYSNTAKLRIKDAELLKSQFGLSMKRGGWTPAEIANKFQINEYVADLKNPDTDNLTKRSSDRMLKNNLQKLGILALIQESMKGFPDGVPAIAEPVMKEMGVDPSIITGQQPQEQNVPQQQEAPEQEAQEQPQEAPAEESAEGMPSPEEMQAMQAQGMEMYGGLMKAQYGMTVPKIGSTYYINGKKVKLSEIEDDSIGNLLPNFINDPGGVYFNDDSNNRYYLSFDDFRKLNSGQQLESLGATSTKDWTGDANKKYIWSTTPTYTAPSITTKSPIKGTNDYLTINNGDVYHSPYGDFEVIDNQAVPRADAPEYGLVRVKNKSTGKIDLISVAEMKDKVGKGLSSFTANGKATTGLPQTGLDNAEVLNTESSTTTPSPFKKGDVYKSKWGSYEIANPNADANGMVELINKQNNQRSKVKLSTMQQAIGTGLTKGGADLISSTPAVAPVQQTQTQQTTQPVQTPRQTSTPAATQTQSGASSQRSSSVTSGPMFSDDIYKMRYGGYLKQFAGAGTSNVPLNTNATPAPDQEKFVSDVSVNGQTYKKFTKGDLVIIKDANGKILSTKNTKTGEKTDYRPDATITYNAKNQRINVDAPDPATQDYKSSVWKGKYSASADEFEKLINDPANENLRNSIYEEFKKIAQDHAAKTGDKSLLNIDKDNAIKLLIKGNRDNATINSVYDGSDLLKSGDWDKTQPNDYTDAAGNKVSGKNLIYNRVASKLGITPMDALSTKVFQGVYQASQNVARRPEYIEKFNKSGFDITPVGVSDQTRQGEAISPVDEIYGNTTVGQMYKLKQDPNIPPPPPPPNKKRKYYCVKQANGVGNVVSVEYNEGETPTAPAGASQGFDDQSTAQMSCAKEQPGLEQAPIKSGPWWLPDIVNYTGTLTDKINRYEPTLEQVSSRTPGYALLDPTRQLAANQSQMQQYNDMLQNTTSGNVAAATALGASGEGFNNAANVLASVEGQNVGIVNSVAGNNAQIQNQQDLLNAQARQNYVGQMATLNQNLDNAEQQRKWRQIAAFNNGTNNWYRKKQMEQVLFPQVFINPISGDAEFSGKGRDYAGYDVYSPAYGSTKGTAFDVQATYDKYRKAGKSDADAKWLTEKELDLNKNSSSNSDVTKSQAYMQALMNQQAGQVMERWGGAITPWDFDV